VGRNADALDAESVEGKLPIHKLMARGVEVRASESWLGDTAAAGPGRRERKQSKLNARDSRAERQVDLTAR